MKSIVILGAGFGGVQTARKLAKRIKKQNLTDKYKVILIDKNTYHTYTPTLYEIATTSDIVASNSQLKRIVALPLNEILEGLPVELVQAEVASIDPMHMELKLMSGTIINYDWLVLALGSQTNFFNIPGLAQHSLPLKTFNDALRIREKIIERVEGEQLPSVRVVIGGGGPTGVELAGEIKNLLNELPSIVQKKCTETVTIIDGAASIIPAFDKKLIATAQKRLAKIGVGTMTNERIQSVDEKEVSLVSGKKVPYDILIWTGGVAANHLMSTLTMMKKDPTGTRIVATEAMVCLPESEDLRLSGKIFGIGDAICFMDPKTGRPTPGVARAAISQGWTVAYNIMQEILAEQDLIHTVKMKHFHPMSYPYVLPIGGKFAISKLGPVVLSGLPAWLFKGVVELNYFLSIFSPLRALHYWFHGLWIFLRNDRLG